MKIKLNSVAFIWLIVICVVFAFPYFYLSSLVGKFPAEDLNSGNYDANYRSLFCMGRQSLDFKVDQAALKARDTADTGSKTRQFNQEIISGVEYIDDVRSPSLPVNTINMNYITPFLMSNSEIIEIYNLQDYSEFSSEGAKTIYGLPIGSSVSTDNPLPVIYTALANQPYFSENLYQLQWKLGSMRASADNFLPSASISLNAAFASSLSDVSEALYFSKQTNMIYAQDKIDNISLTYLWMMKQDGELLDSNLADLYNQAQRFYSPCVTPLSPRGLTEGYWASKGTSVLHHWAHLYEAVVPGGPKLAQYGYLVPSLTQKVLSMQGVEGPTNFVRVSWFIFCVLGIFYIAAFFLLFPEDIFITSLFILVQIFVFFSLKQFYLLLAPGYHWFRELVVVALPLLYIKLFSYPVTENKSANSFNWQNFLIFFSSLALSYYLEPLYTLLSLACIIFSYLWCNRLKISQILMSGGNVIYSLAALTVCLPIFGVIFYGTQKLAYIIDKLSNGDFGLFNIFAAYKLIVYFLMFISSVVLLASKGTEKSFRLNYFALISMFISIYYFVLPDDAHFIKYLEFYVVFLAAVYYSGLLNNDKVISFVKRNYIYRLVENIFISVGAGFNYSRFAGTIEARLVKGAAQTAIIFILAGACYNQVVKIDYGHPERMYRDIWSGKPYFSSERIEINNRIIYADLSEDAIQHLKSFPNEVRSDFVISSYDKYLAFLYDRRNGFAAPDFSSWLNSAKRTDEIWDRISTTKTPINVIVDLNDLEVDARAALLKGNINFKGLAKASGLNMKSKFRVAELIHSVLNYCDIEDDLVSAEWVVARCQSRGE